MSLYPNPSAGPPNAQPPVSAACAELETQIERLTKVLADLDARLTLVISPVLNAGGSPSNKQPDNASGLAGRIRVCAAGVAYAANQVEDLLSRLEI